jgi:hypothetical protein
VPAGWKRKQWFKILSRDRVDALDLCSINKINVLECFLTSYNIQAPCNPILMTSHRYAKRRRIWNNLSNWWQYTIRQQLKIINNRICTALKQIPTHSWYTVIWNISDLYMSPSVWNFPMKYQFNAQKIGIYISKTPGALPWTHKAAPKPSALFCVHFTFCMPTCLHWVLVLNYPFMNSVDIMLRTSNAHER